MSEYLVQNSISTKELEGLVNLVLANFPEAEVVANTDKGPEKYTGKNIAKFLKKDSSRPICFYLTAHDSSPRPAIGVCQYRPSDENDKEPWQLVMMDFEAYKGSVLKREAMEKATAVQKRIIDLR